MTRTPRRGALGARLARLLVSAAVLGGFGTLALAPSPAGATRVHHQAANRHRHSTKGRHHPSADTVKLVKHTGLGKILVDTSGKTLYIFTGDSADKANCTGGCASIWPPLTIAKGNKPKGGPGVRQLGTIKSGDRLQVTWDKHPLYTYSLDNGPGSVNGNGVKVGGNIWYAATSKRVTSHTKPVKHTTTTTTSGSTSLPPGGYGY